MNVNDARDEMEVLDGDSPLQVQINGVVHDIHDINSDSQGVYLIVDTDQEDREMR